MRNDHRMLPQLTLRRRGRLRTAPLVLGAVLSAAFIVGVLLVILALTRGDAPPLLTEEALSAAEARWQEHGPTSYNLDVVIEGRQPGVVHIEVRQGEVTAMTRDGRAPSQRRTWEYWTVPSQFDTMRQDMESATDEMPFGAPAGTQVIQRAEFDEQYGYPLHYQRFVLGTPFDVQWTVTAFEAIESEP